MVNKRDGKKKQGGRNKSPTTPVSPIHRASDTAPSRKVSQDQANQPQHNVSEAAIVKLTAALVRWTGVLAIATIALGVVAYFQWRELHKTDETLQKTLFVSQRAWLSPTMIAFDGEFGVGKRNRIVVHYKNIGHEPAIKVKDHLLFDVINNGEHGIPPNACKDPAAASGYEMTVYPSEVHDIQSSGEIQLTSIEFDEVLKGTKTLQVVGCVAYETFGEIHESRYCYFLKYDAAKNTRDWNFPLCPTGNTGN